VSLSDEQRFLRELSELSKKYGITIWGCGCCGSPGVDGAGTSLDELTWNDKDKRYEAKDSDGKVVK
jgi:hypothetical protein